MAASSRRTVISGIGTLNALGLNAAAVWEGFLQGRSGIRAVRNFDASGLPVRIAGEIPNFQAKHFVEKEVRKSLKMMARTIELAICAAQLALALEGEMLTEDVHRRQSEARFASLVQNSSDVITVVDAHFAIRYIAPGRRARTGLLSRKSRRSSASAPAVA